MNLETKLFPKVSLNNKWLVLQDLWNQLNFNSIKFTKEDEGFFIREYVDDLSFEMRRDFVSMQRYTDTDKYGLLGLSLLNLNDKSVIITEGVSDFFSVKLCNLNLNVLGVTNLGGSTNAKKILVSLFDSVVICMDNDPTGIANGMRWRSLFESQGIKVELYLPEVPNKDVTDEFLMNLKLR